MFLFISKVQANSAAILFKFLLSQLKSQVFLSTLVEWRLPYCHRYSRMLSTILILMHQNELSIAPNYEPPSEKIFMWKMFERATRKGWMSLPPNWDFLKQEFGSLHCFYWERALRGLHGTSNIQTGFFQPLSLT